jgi:hypothetical protein
VNPFQGWEKRKAGRNFMREMHVKVLRFMSVGILSRALCESIVAAYLGPPETL